VTNLTFSLATEADAVTVGANLRPADAVELALSLGKPGEEACLKSLSASIIAWSARRGGRAVAIFGVAPYSAIPGTGIVWMLATPEADAERRALLGKARYYITLMAKLFPRLMNAVYEKNARSLRWLSHLGFKSVETFPEYGVGRAPFRLMVYEAPHV
jgi:hypothetical protein